MDCLNANGNRNLDDNNDDNNISISRLKLENSMNSRKNEGFYGSIENMEDDDDLHSRFNNSSIEINNSSSYAVRENEAKVN